MGFGDWSFIIPTMRNLIIITFLFLMPVSVSAETLVYRYKHFLYTIKDSEQQSWLTTEEKWFLGDIAISPRVEWRVEGDAETSLPEGVNKKELPVWDRAAIKNDLFEKIADKLNQEPGDVVINRDEGGKIEFEGFGKLGLELDLERTADLTISALENKVYDIFLPVREIQPEITVNDPELREKGIKEIVTVGESNFWGSPVARRHNISNGLGKFNGHLIEKDETVSFNEVLGPVDSSTGYKKELVILGDKTLPEYGGGLCQVSTTAYRGVWEYGFPILDRRNHSYAVSYYSPQGTDATIFPPHTDMKFKNDSPGALLIQTYTEGDNAYYVYYGTRDERQSVILGPYTWAHTAPPSDRVEYTAELPPGTKKKVGSRVPGMKALWYRVVKKTGSEAITEDVFSQYQARPLYYQIGAQPAEESPPSWLGM